MKRKTVYTCHVCGCRISKHKVKWEDGQPYCSSCLRAKEKTGNVFLSTSEQYMKIFEQESRKSLNNNDF